MLQCLCEERISWQVANVRTLELGFQAEFSFMLPDRINQQGLRSVPRGCDSSLCSAIAFIVSAWTYPPLELILGPASPSPDYLYTCLYYYENSRKPGAPSPPGSRYSAVAAFEHPVLSQQHLRAHPEHAMEQGGSPRACRRPCTRQTWGWTDLRGSFFFLAAHNPPEGLFIHVFESCVSPYLNHVLFMLVDCTLCLPNEWMFAFFALQHSSWWRGPH